MPTSEVGVPYRINVGGVGVRGSQALATFQNGCGGGSGG